MDEYTACVNKLKEILTFEAMGDIPASRIHVVPGNHDIDRSKYDADNALIESKFSEIQIAWQNIGLSVLAATNYRVEQLALGSCKANIYSLNSCWGCSEYRPYPDTLRDHIVSKVKAQFDKHIKDGEYDKAYSLVAEQLDTPSFKSEHLAEIVAHIGSVHEDCFPIILSHHNLLPQAEPRLSLYAELINAGIARSAFLSCKRPMIYLHGHIHKSPIEIVCNSDQIGKLILVAAPELIAGYNIIDIYYGQKSNPIGCQITPIRFNENTGVVQEDQKATCRIPFYSPEDASQKGSEKIIDIINCLPEPNKLYRYRQFIDNLKRLNKLKNNAPSLKVLLEEAEWFGYIRITNREDHHDNWWIGRVLI